MTKLTLEQINPLRGDTLADRLHSLTKVLLNFRVDIEASLEYAYDSYKYDDVVAGIMQGRFQIYTHNESFVICEMQQMPHYSIYHAFLAGGRLKEVLEMHAALEPVAVKTGAKYATLNGRAGWVKPLKEVGWEPRYTILYKELPNGQDTRDE
jgi:hypothetical protein